MVVQNQNQHQNQKYLIIGQGAIGLPVTNTLADQGFDVTGLARHKRDHYDLATNAQFLQCDALALTAEQLKNFSRIAIIVTPDDYSKVGYENSYLKICQHLASLSDELPNLERILFISSTGIYGQDNGDWIDDTVVPSSLDDNSTSNFILKAEQALQNGFHDKTIIIRPSGIYGRNRLMRVRQAQKDEKEPIARKHWTNRIMDSDLVTIIANVLTTAAPKPLYLATDYLPVTSFELTTWLSDQLGSTNPVIDDRKTAVTGKRLHSNIPCDWLTFPDWQAGYRDILQHSDFEIK
ncbi:MULTISPECIES: SDR family oxidoreductase [Psychrobacter]|uniref:SDR family oxidoreductase n=1 Tax=Psychrobacter TaxID=497 RepID=UPI00146A58CC|nr:MULTISPECIES: SDR family oxidoreductase [Psychrobacter]